MVKGVSRRVIVVRSPDPRFFEQAIFLMKEDALNAEGVTAEQVVAEARQAAAGYMRRNAEDGHSERALSERLPWWGWFLAGGGAAAVLGLLCSLF